MEKETKNWWVIFVTYDVQTVGEFDVSFEQSYHRLASEFLTETEAVELACLVTAVVYGGTNGEPLDYPDEFKHKVLPKIKDRILYEENLFDGVRVDKTEGRVSFDLQNHAPDIFVVQLQCLDFSGERNFAAEIRVAREFANKLTS